MSVLERNLAALAKRHHDMAAALLTAGGGVLSVSPARNGLPTASTAGGQIHSAYDPWKEAVTWAEKQEGQCRADERLVIFGVGLLYHVEALQQRVSGPARLAVVVADIREFHDACAARPMESWLDRIDWLAGSPEEIGARLAGFNQPTRILRYVPATRRQADVYAGVEKALQRAAAQAAGGRLHVAVVGPIYGGSLPVAQYTVAALEALGHRVTWLDHSGHFASYVATDQLKDSRLRLTTQARFVEWLGLLTQARLGEDPPDLVLALAQAPLSLPILERLRHKKLLTAMWFVENYRLFTYWRQLAAGYDHWFVIQRGACIDNLRRVGARHVSYLPLAADPQVHRPLDLSPEEQREFGADVSFVGAGYPNRRALFPQLLGREWTFKLWGNEWAQPGPLTAALQRNGARIDTGTTVKIFNATTVNVNLHSHAGIGLDPDADFVNPRTFELAACGAYQVVDRRALLSELFENDLAVFEKAEDLIGLVRLSLADRGAREDRAAAARRRVLGAHTYTHRMTELLASIGVACPDRIGTILRGERQAGVLARRPDAAPDIRVLLAQFPSTQRVELQDVAARLRARSPGATFTREELLVLMLDEYRQEVRDFA
jgi:spore maturation protein CgeB